MNQSLQLDVPVLFLTFNRLETTKRVFEQIKKQKPSQLFLASDGPRFSIAGEADVVHSVRKFLLDSIDWRCEVHTLFRPENLGNGLAVSSAVSWFFDHVEYGIILEDDCLPSDSFFKFTSELLLHYKNETSIMHISGYNPLDISLKGTDSYYFTKIQQCWGWASWRRAWKNYSFNISPEKCKKFVRSRKFKQFFPHFAERPYWKRLFKEMTKNKADVWDSQWEFAIAENMGFCINPCRNLVSNIGLSNEKYADNIISNCNNILRYEITDINHPEEIIFSNEFTDRISEEYFNIPINHIFKYYVNLLLKYVVNSAKKLQNFCSGKIKKNKGTNVK